MMSLEAAGVVVIGFRQMCGAVVFGVILTRLLMRLFQEITSKDNSLYILTSTIFFIHEASKLLCMIIYQVVIMDPFLLLNPRNWAKACRFSFKTGKVIARAQLKCMIWSADNLKTLVYKACAPGQLTTEDYLKKNFPIGIPPDWAQEDHDKHRYLLKTCNTKFSLLRALPLRTVSRTWGKMTRMELPVCLRTPTYQMYTRVFGCKPDECTESDLSQYASVCQFFRRSLRPGLRPVSYKHELTSPADGTVLYMNEVKDGVLEQVKGVTYSLQGFLGPPEGDATCTDVEYQRRLVTQSGNRLYQCIIYLGPGDYHHFHSPADWSPNFRRHFPGELFSVSPSFARWVQGLFNMNERAIYTGRWHYGFFSMTAVGATNVGSINVKFDPTLETNIEEEFEAGIFYDAHFTSTKKRPLRLSRGEEIGDFSLGSTIVLLFEAPKSFNFNIRPGQKVKVGEGIGNVRRQRKHTKRK